MTQHNNKLPERESIRVEIENARQEVKKEATERFNAERAKKQLADEKNGKTKRVVDGKGLAEIIDDMAAQKVISDLRRQIGNRLMEIREQHGLKQNQVVERYSSCLQITVSCLSKWENGEHKIDWLFLLWFSEEFGVDLHWLLTGENRASKNELVEEARKKASELSEILEKI